MEMLTIAGAELPRVGLGTYELTGPLCARTVEKALTLGYRHIDTAQYYGNEAEVGRGVTAADVPRERLWLTTKIWPTELAPADLTRAVEGSLARLGTDYLDLLLIHWPSPDVPLRESLGAMERLRRAGKTRFVGVSNFSPSLTEEALELAPIFTNQVEHHPFLGQDRLRTMARERGFVLTAYSPLAQGGVLESPVLTEIGRTHGKSAAQVALRWLLQQENVATIPKASSEDHLEANLLVFDFELEESEMERIEALAEDRRLVETEYAPRWRA